MEARGHPKPSREDGVLTEERTLGEGALAGKQSPSLNQAIHARGQEEHAPLQSGFHVDPDGAPALCLPAVRGPRSLRSHFAASGVTDRGGAPSGLLGV